MKTANLNVPATKGDLEDLAAQIVQAVVKAMEHVSTKTDLTNLKNELKSDISSLKSDVGNLQSDVSNIKRHVIDLERDTPAQIDVEKLKQRVEVLEERKVASRI